MPALKCPSPHLLLLAVLLAAPLSADFILFDASKHEMGGNADWVIDADAWNLNMPAYPCSGTTNESNPGRYPTPNQSGIGPSTPGTYWTGGISSWAVELVKAGHTVETLPDGAAITFGDAGNPQDLANYDLFIIPEPQNPFTAAEKTAILAFVNAGGGLFMVADHETSDRDCDGWDSPNIFNDLTGATSASDAGVFGIWFRVDDFDVKGEDWFDDATDNNVETDPADPIINGPFGSGAGGLGFFGATSMDLDYDQWVAGTVKAHVWRTGQAHNHLRVTFATATYGAGRVAAIGDSSPADDDTGDPGDTLYPGWDLASGGVNNKEIHLNACHWLLNPVPDTTPPGITAGPSAAAADCSAVVTWTTDEPATSLVEYGPTVAYGSSAGVPGYTQNHSVILPGLSPESTYHYRVLSSDAVGNGPTVSGDATFATVAAAAPVITTGPAAGPVTGTSATITWTTDEAATSLVYYGPDASYGSTATVSGYTTGHSVPITGLVPETPYHYQVSSTDACGNGPTTSSDAVFTTGPAAIDLSGWILKQYNSTLTYTFPAGTFLPSGGYLVVARNATRAEFETFYNTSPRVNPMPAATVFLNSNASGSCANGCMPQINGAETYELYDASATLVDAPSVVAADNNAYQRNAPGENTWTTVGEDNANPGQGAGTPSSAGVVINEVADASDYTKEFIELYNDGGTAAPDTTAPSTVSNLSAAAVSPTSILLAWTAPGDDGTNGTATGYDIRRAGASIATEGAFDAATPVPFPPDPAAAGTPQQMTVTGLTPGTQYFFALKTRDEVPNWSGLSNSPGATTPLPDTTPPAAVTDLAATPLSAASIRLDWTAPGDDGGTGTATLYDIRRSSARILSEADFYAAAPVAGAPAPAAAGTPQQMTVTGLAADTPYYFALKTKDEAGAESNCSALSNWTGAVTGTGVGGPVVDHLVISQVQTNGDGGADDEFVEIYNPTASLISLAGWSLQYHNTSTTGSFVKQSVNAGSVPSHGYFLIARSAYNGSPTADLTNTGFSMSGTAATLFLVNNQTTISSCSAASIVDKVGYGTGTFHCPEGTAVGAPGSDNSIVRKPGGTQGSGQDTDNNQSDFQGLSPAVPHNSASPAATPPSALGNVGPTLYLEGPSSTGLRWSAAAAATGYRVYRGTTADFKTPPNAPDPWQTAPVNSASDPAAPPEPSFIYFYTVRATDGTNESAN